MRADRSPAACHGILGSTGDNHLGSGILSVCAEEGIAVGVKTCDRSVDRIERVVIAALAVFRLVVNCGTVNLYLTGGKITLEVRHVIHGVPEAEFHVGENGERLWRAAVVGECELVDLAAVVDRNKSGQLCGEIILGTAEGGISHAVMALIGIQLGLCGHPSRIPDCIAFLNIVVMTVAVERDVVIAVSGQTQELCVFIKTVSAAGVGDQGKEIL